MSEIPSRLRIGTRGSPLALWQANHVARQLEAAHPGLAVELVRIKTGGDQIADVPMAQVGGKGIFVKEIEDALLDGAVDLAVHSSKDLPTDAPEGLEIAAFLERHDPRDAILTVEGTGLDALPPGTVVATGSPRRRCQILHRRPDLAMTLVRGNVDTRIRKLREGRFGAMALAVAGIERLGITDAPYTPIPVEICIPAVGQGAVAVEIRSSDAGTRRAVAVLAHAATAAAVAAERAFLRRLGGGCLAPAAAHARVVGPSIALVAMVGDPDGRRLLRDRAEGDVSRGESLGEGLAERLLGAGGEAILRDARAAGGGNEA